MLYKSFDATRGVTPGSVAIIPSEEGKKITVYGLVLVATADTAITIRDGSTDLSGPMRFTVGAPVVLPNNGTYPWLPDADGDLNFYLSALGHVAGWVIYLQQ